MKNLHPQTVRSLFYYIITFTMFWSCLSFHTFDGRIIDHFFIFLYSYVLAQASCMHIYIYGLFTLYFFCYHIVTGNYVFILLYMMLYKHISYHKIPFCIFIRNKYLVSFVLDFLSLTKFENVYIFHWFPHFLGYIFMQEL